jgi:flagellar hook-length control protein FliK
LSQISPAQIIDQAAQAIYVTHLGGQAMQFLVTPPDLGSLHVSVSVHDGVLSARLETQNPATQQVLIDNLSQLKDSLTQQGVSFDRIDVHLMGSSGGAGGSGSTDPSFGRQREGGSAWDQSPPPPVENENPTAGNLPVRGPTRRVPLTSLDVMI